MFSLKTHERSFDLFAPSADEKALWVHTFKWIIFNNTKSKKEILGQYGVDGPTDSRPQSVTNKSRNQIKLEQRQREGTFSPKAANQKQQRMNNSMF